MTVGRSQQAQAAARTDKSAASIDRYKSRIAVQQAANQAGRVLTAGDSLEDRFATLERDQQVEALLLEELKQKKALPGLTAAGKLQTRSMAGCPTSRWFFARCGAPGLILDSKRYLLTRDVARGIGARAGA